MRKTNVFFDNNEVLEYTIKNENITLKVLNFGAAITSLEYKGVDVVLSYQDYNDYYDNGGNLGFAILPNANRIALSKFELNDKVYHLQKNDGENNLHSNNKSAGQKKFWEVEQFEDKLVLTCQLTESDDNFPGNRKYIVEYKLNDSALDIEYSCISDEKTLFNPTQHTYFNLDGIDSRSILNHKLFIDADYITEVDSHLIPTGNLIEVTNTPFDFRESKLIGRDIASDNQLLLQANGYDHNFCLDRNDGKKEVAILENDNIRMKIITDMVGIQVYTGNYLGDEVGKNGIKYTKNSGVALETQFYPDCINQDNFVKSIVEPNILTKHFTTYKFEDK